MRNQLSLLHLALTICAVLSLNSCINISADTEQTPLKGVQLPDGFTEFYDRFHRDTAFQAEHVVFPLAGNMQADTANRRLIDVRWQKADWNYHRPLDTAGFIRELEPANNDLVLEHIRSSSGDYEIIRRFARLGDDWHLIYYSASTMGTR